MSINNNLADMEREFWEMKTCFTYWKRMIECGRAHKLTDAQIRAYERICEIKRLEHTRPAEAARLPLLPPI